MDMELVIALNVLIGLFVGFLIVTFRMIRNIANQFGTSLTELRRMTMEENYRNKFKMINLNESNQFNGDISDWNLKFNALQIDTKRSELKKLSDQRTKLIQDCLEDGLSVINISEATNISRQRVYRILNKGD